MANVFTDDTPKNVFADDREDSKETGTIWTMILVAGVIGIVLFLIGICLYFRWKRSFGGKQPIAPFSFC